MKNYIINDKTILLKPLDINKTEVLEINKTYIVEKKAINIIKKSCEYYGSTYLGRHEATKILLNKYYKSPIIVEESKNIIFFPTKSPRLEDCIWISLNNLENYEKKDNYTILKMKKNKKIDINITYNSFNNMYLNALKLESILIKRKN